MRSHVIFLATRVLVLAVLLKSKHFFDRYGRTVSHAFRLYIYFIILKMNSLFFKFLLCRAVYKFRNFSLKFIE